MNWYRIVKKSQTSPQISINISGYEQSLRQKAQELLDWGQNERERLSSFQINLSMIQQILTKYQYQDINGVIQAINSKQVESIVDLYWKISAFEREINKIQGWKAASEIYPVTKQIRDYMRFLEQSAQDYQPWSLQDMNQEVQTLLQQTRANAEKIATTINSAIGRISNWNGSNIKVEVGSLWKDQDWTQPISSAAIEVGFGGGLDPMFTVFEVKEDGSAEIDDVADAGDEEYFKDSRIQSDYFNLVKELSKPGSTSGRGKILTLYTARPVKDRQLYIDAKQIPSNIFLTNNYSSAGGLAIDLAGSDPRRDVWKVRIEDKYLVQTLDGMEKQYQVVGDGFVPVHSMTLIDPGD